VLSRSLAFGGFLLLSLLSQRAVALDITFYIPGLAPVTYPAPWTSGMTVEQAMQRSGVKYVVAWFPGGLGSALLIAQGVPFLTNGSIGTPFWWLCINGQSASSGMTTARVPSAQSRIQWYWTSQAACVAQ
jgi:hypothetical protein